MGTFFMLAITISMLLTYLRSLFRTKLSAEKVQTELVASFKVMENQGLSRDFFKRISVITATGMTIVYFIFYISSAVIINTTWATVIAALFGVLSFRNLLIAIDFVKSEKVKKINPYSKIITLVGLVYTVYFLIYYVTIKFNVGEIFYLVIGCVVGAVIILITKLLKKKK